MKETKVIFTTLTIIKIGLKKFPYNEIKMKYI